MKSMPEKVAAIINAPPLVNVAQLCSFLRLLSYYRIFSPNVINALKPLYSLLDNGLLQSWTKLLEKTFQKVKNVLRKIPILELYDTKKYYFML